MSLPKRIHLLLVLVIICILFLGCNPFTEKLAATGAASTNTPIPPSVTPTPAHTLTPVPSILPSSTPGTVVYFSDDFSQLSSRYDYADDSVEIKQSEGGLSVSIEKTDWISFVDVPGYEYEDVAIEVEAFTAGGDPEDGYGIICRATVSSEYMFEITYDGYYGIFLWEEDVGYTTLKDYTRSSSINTGLNKKNHINVVCYENHLILQVNGVLLANITNDELSNGEIYLFAVNDSFSNVNVIFDNLYVTKPDDIADYSEDPNLSSETYACQSPSTISEEDAGKLIEVCGEITNWGDVPCPNCALGGYSFLKLDNSFLIISYEWVFNNDWLGGCIRAADTVEMLGNDPVFVYGKGEGYAGSDCITDENGIMTCSGGDYFGESDVCD